MAFVYWIHLPEQTDMFSEGYIGFTTKSVETRFKKHLHDANTVSKSRRHNTLQNAIRKYGDVLVVDTLIEGSVDYCLMLENKLRPKPSVGWNIAIGGEKPTLGVKLSKETREKQSKSHKGRTNSPEARKKISEALKGKKKPLSHLERLKQYNENLNPWENGRANKDVWAIAREMFSSFVSEPCGAVKLSNRFGLKEWAVSNILEKFRSGWNPNEDIDYLTWLANFNNKEAFNAA